MIHMRPFNAFEEKNISFLVKHQIDFATIEVTSTGLNKSILDATYLVREYFKKNKIHDYALQGKGESNRVYISTIVFEGTAVCETKTSLYRPETKDGDPRLWIYKVSAHVSPNDILILIANQGNLFVINMTKTDIESCFNSPVITPLKDFLVTLSNQNKSISEELLRLLRTKVSGWQKAEVLADTGIGRTIESLLGIDMNSKKEPDYKGIELKSKRDKSKVRSTLFSQVPNWDLSALKSGQEIVEHYGYVDKKLGRKVLRVTIKNLKPNLQTLCFNFNHGKNLLELVSANVDNDIFAKNSDVAVWQLETLHTRLLEKHKETFWIDVETQKNNGNECFRICSIEHTKNPIPSQFDVLLENSKISMDLLLCRGSGGDTFGFKMNKEDRKYLFPESEIYIF